MYQSFRRTNRSVYVNMGSPHVYVSLVVGIHLVAEMEIEDLTSTHEKKVRNPPIPNAWGYS